MNEYIYHYTTLNTLALMFSNKTLRLNSLANVDDMQEGYADIFGDMSKYIFVSSWTRDKAENVALWNMYTPNMKGVRIGIPASSVKLEHGDDNEVVNIHSKSKILDYKNADFLTDVDYLESHIADLFDKNGGLNRENIAKLGKIKSKIWSFQNEVRFILMGLPANKVEKYPFLSRENNFFEKILHKEDSAINYIDLQLEENSWDNAEIVLGPNTDLGDKRILGALVKTYFPDSNISIRKSDLKIRAKRF
ncbi:DUF2971 domain-containing protein [Vibrio owensii]